MLASYAPLFGSVNKVEKDISVNEITPIIAVEKAQQDELSVAGITNSSFESSNMMASFD
jgi:hypothetical protein